MLSGVGLKKSELSSYNLEKIEVRTSVSLLTSKISQEKRYFHSNLIDDLVVHLLWKTFPHAND